MMRRSTPYTPCRYLFCRKFVEEPRRRFLVDYPRCHNIVEPHVFFCEELCTMSYNDPARFSSSPGLHGIATILQNGRTTRAAEQATIFHGEGLARDIWAEQFGPWIVLGFSAAFALFLIIMELAGQVAGQSFILKSISDILQFVGEGIGFVFCVRIAVRLYHTSRNLKRDLVKKERGELFPTPAELAQARTEAQLAQRSFLAWAFLSIAIASYASGQAIWTSYDV